MALRCWQIVPHFGREWEQVRKIHSGTEWKAPPCRRWTLDFNYFSFVCLFTYLFIADCSYSWFFFIPPRSNITRKTTRYPQYTLVRHYTSQTRPNQLTQMVLLIGREYKFLPFYTKCGFQKWVGNIWKLFLFGVGWGQQLRGQYLYHNHVALPEHLSICARRKKETITPFLLALCVTRIKLSTMHKKYDIFLP